MTQVAIGVSYNGAGLRGWQRQANQPTVQEFLENAITRVADEPILLVCAGRTDAGVHATGQVAAFRTHAKRKPNEWLRGINSQTPKGIHVNWVHVTDDAFHPRYSATARRYTYVYAPVQNDPFLRDLAWGCDPLDADAMHRAAQVLLGEHDFSSFRAAGCQSLTPMRRVNRCEVRRVGFFVVLDIEANAFLLHMVRNIAAALRDVGCSQAQRPMRDLLEAHDRSLLGPTAPPHGLYLRAVSYARWTFPAGPPPSILMGSSTP